MSRYHGKRAKIFLGPSAGAAAVPVASLAVWSLSAKSDRADVTSFGDGNKVRVVGLPDFSGKFDGFFDDADSNLFLAAEVLGGVNCYLYPDFTNAPTRYWYGTANVDYDISANITDAVKIAANWDAAGTWARK